MKNLCCWLFSVEITKACVEMIILDELPFSFVEGRALGIFALGHVLSGMCLVARQLLRLYLPCTFKKKRT